MAQRTVFIPEIGEVLLVKRRGSKNLRLSIQPNGRIRVGLPYWAPYSTAIHFAKKRAVWIKQNTRDKQPPVLKNGHKIGKTYSLRFISEPSSIKISTRLKANLIVVTGNETFSNRSMQLKAVGACERALKKDADTLLADRLNQIAGENKLVYKKLKIKRMVSRWGSYSQDGTVTLNYFLIQLPWHLIDYVLVHELAHISHLNHSQDFWNFVETILPDAKTLKKEIKNYRPVLIPVEPFVS